MVVEQREYAVRRISDEGEQLAVGGEGHVGEGHALSLVGGVLGLEDAREKVRVQPLVGVVDQELRRWRMEGGWRGRREERVEGCQRWKVVWGEAGRGPRSVSVG